MSDETAARRWCILAVDDDPSVLAFLAAALSAEFDVRTASGGEEALAAYRDRRPDLVILDVRMPGSDGPATLAAMLELDPSARCVFLTAESFPYSEDDLMRAGALAVLAKPAPPRDLRAVVRRLAGPPPAAAGPVLLVEDDPHDAELGVQALRRAGLDAPIDVARDGGEALDYLRRRGRFAGRPDVTPALVLLDLKMPRVGGFDVLGRVRSDPALRGVPVVVLSGSTDPEDVGRCYALGASAYLVKPSGLRKYTEVARSLAAFWTVLNVRPPV